MLQWLTDPDILAAFFTLTALEIILGIDNIIFISILVNRLPKHLQAKGRFFGIMLAMVTRILLLLSMTWVMRLTHDLFSIFGLGISGRDIILIGGGLFLLLKSTLEIWHSVEGSQDEESKIKGSSSFLLVLVQIAIIDIIFSLDSVITAVGLVQHVPVMVAAIMTSVFVMLVAASTINRYIEEHPTLKILALSFLIMVGTLLIAEGFDVAVPKGYVYFAMAFSFGVEILNIKMRSVMANRNKVKELKPESEPQEK